jgi:GDP-D-mannose dehydratase
MVKVLLTGIDGFIYSYLVEILVDKGYQIKAI